MIINVFVICILASLIFTSATTVSTTNQMNDTSLPKPILTWMGNNEVYVVPTWDNSSITLTRYPGTKQPLIFIHGMGSNHLMYDFDTDHSLAQYLNAYGWDVWLLDLRTHDGDGDYLLSYGSDREYIDRYWDFDNTLLKIDVVTAVDFVKQHTTFNTVVLSGHSYGGYLAYAYAMIIGEDDLSGILTTGACPYANPEGFQQLRRDDMDQYGYYDGNYAYVNPNGKEAAYPSGPKLRVRILSVLWPFLDHSNSQVFYEQTTSYDIQKKCLFIGDAEAAGVYVDMIFGRDPEKYGDFWIDPQTLFNYSEHLRDITVPICFIAGDKDPQDPALGIYHAYENVSSKDKTYLCFPDHSHLDLLLGEDASILIFPMINGWLEERFY